MECASIHKVYAKTHKRPEGPIDHFKSEMPTLEDADKGSFTHSAAWKIMPDKRLKPEKLGVEKSPHATQNVGVTGVITTASPKAVGEDADVIVPATTVTIGHSVTRVLTCVVLHVVMMIVTTDAVDAIRAMDTTGPQA